MPIPPSRPRRPSCSPGVSREAPDGKGFILTQQAGAPGSVTSPQTGSAPGASATGDAPSGSVTAGYPNRNDGHGDCGADPAGRGARNRGEPLLTDIQPGAGCDIHDWNCWKSGHSRCSNRIRFVSTDGAPKGLDLAAHVGHTVQVRGVLAPDPRAPRAASSSSAVQADNPPVFTVETLTHRAATCTR